LRFAMELGDGREKKREREKTQKRLTFESSRRETRHPKKEGGRGLETRGTPHKIQQMISLKVSGPPQQDCS